MAISRPPLPSHNCTNIQPTEEKCTALQLPQPSHVTHDEPGTSNVNIDVGKPQEVSEFEDFSSELPDLPHHRREERFLKSNFRKFTIRGTEAILEGLYKKNHSELMKVVGEKDNKTEKKHNVDQDIGGSAVDGDEQTDKGDQQSVLPNHMDCSKEQHMEDAIEVIHSPQCSHVLIEKVALNNENDYTTGEASHSDTKILNADEHDVYTLEQNIEKHTTSLFSVDTSTEVENNVQPLCLMSHGKLIESVFWLSDSQLPTQLPVKKSSLPPDTETPAPRHRMPSRIIRSPYLTDFGSNDKGKAKIDDDVLPHYSFEGCGILEQLPI
uniref:Uncharacterized protein n=1 Tax=Solanum lycopersicum TaxID=4081 RepID=A0A3Q7IW35_SOLLC